MADEKTEKPTAKRRKDAREEGRVAKSNDLAAGFTLLAMFGAMKVFGSGIVQNLEKVIIKYLTHFAEYTNTTVDIDMIHLKLSEGYLYIFITIAPLMLAALLFGLGIQYAQVGVLKKKDLMKMQMDKLNPINGIKNMFSMKTVVETIKSILKFVIMAYVLYKEINERMTSFPALAEAEIGQSILYMIDIILSVGFKLAGISLAIGVADYIYQKWSYEKSLMMSKQEIKDEYKQQEGDPKIKSKIKQKQQQIAMQRMMQSVPTADVVITNPTHYAVALKYDDSGNGAPVVVAKGKDFVARRIKEKAKECRIEMVENRPLAQALYKAVPVGMQIPPEFYRAVAEILAQIYRKKRRKIKR